MTSVRITDTRTERIRRKTHPEYAAKESRVHQLRQSVLLLLLIVTCFIAAGFAHNFIPSESMEPNLRPGDHIVTMRAWLAYPFGAMPSRGDVIVFRLPNTALPGNAAAQANGTVDAATHSNTARTFSENMEADDENGQDNPPVTSGGPSDILIKRVIGLPGDVIQLKDNTLYVNGHIVKENYPIVRLDNTNGYDFPFGVYQPFRVPPGQLFVLGDNRSNSEDSRFWGTLPRENVIGRFVRVLYHESKYDLTEAAIPGRQE